MNKKKIYMSMLVVLIVIMIALFIMVILVKPQYFKYYVDTSEVPISTKITSIKDGLIAANDRAKIWHKNARLTGVTASFKGINEINTRTGEIAYHYNVRNLGLFRDVGVHCFVDIDMEKNSIIKFTSTGGATDTNFGLPCDIESGDITDIFEIAIEKFGQEIFDKYSEPCVVISTYGGNIWYFNLFNTSNNGITEIEGLFVEIDSKSRKVLNYRNKR